MTKKKMLAMSLVVVCIVAMMGAIALFGSSTEPTPDYEAELLDRGESALDIFRLRTGDIGDLEYKVTVDENRIYTVNINGEESQVFMPEKADGDGIQVADERNCPMWVKSLVKDAKRKVKAYIDSSNVLKDKEELKKGIDRIKPVMAEFVGEDADTVAFYEDSQIFGVPSMGNNLWVKVPYSA